VFLPVVFSLSLKETDERVQERGRERERERERERGEMTYYILIS
jgi:hypothetical protein